MFSAHWDRGAVYYGRDRFTKASYRHDFTRSEIFRSRIERFLPPTGRSTAAAWSSLAVTAVFPNAGAMMYQLATGRARVDGLYSAGAVAFRRLR